MSNDSSLGGSVVHSVFDLDSQKGVAQLLMSIRASKINPEYKNELRDLVFQYMNGGKDQSVRISIEQKLQRYNVVVSAALYSPKKVDVANDKPVIGSSRPAPTFSAKPAPVFVESKPITPVVSSQPAPVAEVIVNEPVVTREEVKSAEVLPKTAEVVLETDKSGAEEGLRRIREIKSRVNEKIGNPVNLVDIDNNVGREYMSAMLDAMKKLSTGSSAVSAMKRLEDAYVQVERTIAEHNKMNLQSIPEPISAMVENLSTEPVVSASPKPEPILPRPAEIIETAPVVVEEVLEENPEIEEIPPTDEEVVKEEIPEVIPREPVPLPRPVAINKPPVETMTSWGSDGDSAKTGVRATSLAETKTKLRTPDELPLASALETSSVAGDPLYTKEVDEGLQQLLLEWSIFKKSGLFGNGPKGIDHPLFKKISSLQIPLLLAGRFEGATQEIKQSITDYMNGWRYEQGIIYEQGEDFEHYLRRVIRHIIDLQKKRRSLS